MKPLLCALIAVLYLPAPTASTAYGQTSAGLALRCTVGDVPPDRTEAPRYFHVKDVGPFVLRVPDTESVEAFDYLVELVETILPSMERVMGPPAASLDTLTVSVSGQGGFAYWCGWNHIVMTPIEFDSDRPNDRGWDSVFIHELVHAFQDDLLCVRDRPRSAPSWFTEGMAEAVRYFVQNEVTDDYGRDVRARPYARLMVVAIGSAIFAGIYPAWHVTRMQPVASR